MKGSYGLAPLVFPFDALSFWKNGGDSCQEVYGFQI